MAKKPTEAPAPKKTGPLGAYRVEGGHFAAYDAQGRTTLIDQAAAEALGIRGA